MSFKAMNVVWSSGLQPPSLKLTALALADWSNDEGGSLHPSMAAIAKKVGVSRCQARRLVQLLKDAGLLSVLGNAHGGAPGDTPQYRLNLEAFAHWTGSTSETGGVSETAITGETGSASARGSAGASRRVAPMRETGSTSATLTTIEPSIEPSGKVAEPPAPPALPAGARDPLPKVDPPAEDTPPDRQDRPAALRAVPAGGVAAISPAVAICVALRQAGIGKVNPDNPTLRELVAQGATTSEFLGMVDKAKDKNDPFAYLIAAVAGERQRALKLREQSIGLKPPGQVFGDNAQPQQAARKGVAPLWRQRQALRHLEAYGRFADIDPWDLPPNHPMYPPNAQAAQGRVVDVQATPASTQPIGDAHVRPLAVGR